MIKGAVKELWYAIRWFVCFAMIFCIAMIVGPVLIVGAVISTIILVIFRFMNRDI